MASTRKATPSQGDSKRHASTTKTPRLTPAQHDMLWELGLGPFTPHGNELARARSLVRRGLATWGKPYEPGGRRLRITDAGRAALAKADGATVGKAGT